MHYRAPVYYISQPTMKWSSSRDKGFKALWRVEVVAVFALWSPPTAASLFTGTQHQVTLRTS